MEIVKLPQSVLKKKTEDIINFDDELRILTQRMFVDMEKADGIGLAAPQIGISKNIAVIGYVPTEAKKEKYPDLVEIPKTVLINPKIVWKSKDYALEKEGCLSIPESEYAVPRAKKIHVEYFDEFGNKKKIKAKGFLARVLQHEIDHLNGTTISDYE